MRLGRGDRHPGLFQQLDGLFVHAHHRVFGIVGLRIGFEHLFHVPHELSVLLGRNHPILDLALGHAIFFSVLRTVSGQIDLTTSNATSSSANRCSDHRPYPAGGFPNRSAINFAAPSPSSLGGVGGVPRFLRSNAASHPSVTKRSRRFSTVRTEQPCVAAILASVHSGPSASARSRI